MRSTEILREEHRWIRRMVDCLDRLVEISQEPGALDGEAALELIGLFATFGDSRHQEKEELLFPRLQMLANAEEEALVDGLLEEHASDQGQLLHMRASLLDAVQGDPVGEREFIRRAVDYVALQRGHMAKENAVMFPLADRLLTVEHDSELLGGFERIEARAGGRSAREFQQIEALCHRLGVLV